jgi:hypothetical protein
VFQIGKTLVSREIFEQKFVCDLTSCKGACCVEGESGAPLEQGEAEQIAADYEKIKPFMRPEGIEAVDQQGIAVRDTDGDWVTPLIAGKECAFVQFDEQGVAKCSIEAAWREGKTSFRKPVSCHLYPIRIKSYGNHDSINYDRIEICNPACRLGAALKISVFRFVREALERKYGTEWVVEAGKVEQEWLNQGAGSGLKRGKRRGLK